MKKVKNWLSQMLSEGSASSCTRFCVIMVFTTLMLNFTFSNVYSMIAGKGPITFNIQELIALFGIVGMKLGQKKMESK